MRRLILTIVIIGLASTRGMAGEHYRLMTELAQYPSDWLYYCEIYGDDHGGVCNDFQGTGYYLSSTQQSTPTPCNQLIEGKVADTDPNAGKVFKGVNKIHLEDYQLDREGEDDFSDIADRFCDAKTPSQWAGDVEVVGPDSDFVSFKPYGKTAEADRIYAKVFHIKGRHQGIPIDFCYAVQIVGKPSVGVAGCLDHLKPTGRGNKETEPDAYFAYSARYRPHSHVPIAQSTPILIILKKQDD